MKIFCIGRNYVNHAKELNNPVPESPVIFMKPSTALLINNRPLYYPEFTSDLHYEAEIVIKICKNGRHVQPGFAHTYYDQWTLGLDFTARDVQIQLKSKGLPWEKAKAWDHSAAIGTFQPIAHVANIQALNFSLRKNGQIVQAGNTADMIFSIDQLIVQISKYFKLQTGDLVFTGTPAGVGPVQIGDVLEGFVQEQKVLSCEIK